MDIREQIERLRNIQDCWAGDLCEAADTMEKLLAALEAIDNVPMYLQRRRDNYAAKAHKMHNIAHAALDKQEQDDG